MTVEYLARRPSGIMETCLVCFPMTPTNNGSDRTNVFDRLETRYDGGREQSLLVTQGTSVAFSDAPTHNRKKKKCVEMDKKGTELDSTRGINYSLPT